MHWHVPRNHRARHRRSLPAGTDRYILLVQGPFAYLPGEGEQYITATRRGGRWWITPNTTARPRRGTSPGD